MNDAASLLREARTASGITQTELARRIGTTQSVVARLESPRSNPRFRTLGRALAGTGHELRAELRPMRQGVDESLIAANLRMPPGERLRQFAAAYRNVAELARKADRSRGS